MITVRGQQTDVIDPDRKIMDTEISSVNTSFVGVVFPVLPASPIKRVINARKVPPLCRGTLTENEV